MRTVALVGATRAIFSRSWRIAALRPVISDEPSRRTTVSRSRLFSRTSRVCSIARVAEASNTSGTKGLVMKSNAPRRMLSTASSMVANAVRKTTDRVGSTSRAAASTSSPSPSPIFWSVMTASNVDSTRAPRASLTPAASTTSCWSCLRLEMSIRRKCGSSSAINIFPIIFPLSESLAPGARRYLDGKADPLRFVDSQYDIAAVCSRDVASDRKTKSVAALLGGKQWFENARHDIGRNRSGWIDHVDSDRALSVRLGVESHQVAAVACIDRVENQVQKRLMHLGRIEISLKTAVGGHIDRYAFIGRVCAGDCSDVVQRVGDVNRSDLHRARTRVDEEVGSQPLETLGFLRCDRKHFLSFDFVLTRPRGGS